ncbi:MAG: hypothetical protein MUE68_06665 [Bacteroidetes bacterium]|nr:hypothetical protein [Bacteroidota bacterium]
MFERTLHVAAQVLAAESSSPVPLRSLWESVSKQSRAKGFELCSLADFAAMLECDPRFHVDRLDGAGNEDGSDEERDEDLVKMGIWSAWNVSLRRKARPAEDDVDEMPSLPLRHLSETRAVASTRGTNGADRPSRGKTTARKPASRPSKRRKR